MSGRPMTSYGTPLLFDLTGAPSVRVLAHGRWRESGLCRGLDTEWWFAKPTSARSRGAVTLCERCPVRNACLAAGLVFGEEFGVWGGVNHLERRPMVQRLLGGETLGSVLTSVLGEQVARPARKAA